MVAERVGTLSGSALTSAGPLSAAVPQPQQSPAVRRGPIVLPMLRGLTGPRERILYRTGEPAERVNPRPDSDLWRISR